MFFTERVGDVNVLRDGAGDDVQPTARCRAAQGEGGMMGIAVDPAFDSTRRIFTCYLTAADVRVVRFTVSRPTGPRSVSSTPIIDHEHPAHERPALRVPPRVPPGPTALLWVTTGDAADARQPRRARAVARRQGAADHDRRQASPPATWIAPYQLPADLRLRLPQPAGHLSWRPTDDQPFLIEHGPTCDDEITPPSTPAATADGTPGPGLRRGASR